MERSKLKTEEWTRVRFGAGTPWRRCWCVISPPDEKEVQKLQKSLKKKSAYERPASSLKGDIKFYDTKKTKKARPIATINDAYSAYAIYPQSKPLIDQSTLVKVEGTITIHSNPETTTEGFVFVMPEVHPAVSGFEMMLRWLFPVYDVFALYGRPNRLVADTLDVRSLMFAMPQEKRYGYLEILDVSTLIHENGSQMWKDKEWRGRLKELTASRMKKLHPNGSRQGSRANSSRGHRSSLPSRNGALRFDDTVSIRSTPSMRNEVAPFPPPHKTESAPPGNSPFQPPKGTPSHQRAASETTPFSTPRHQRSVRENQPNYTPSRLSYEATRSEDTYETPPPPPPTHGVPLGSAYRNPQMQRYAAELDSSHERSSSESEKKAPVEIEAQEIRQDLRPSSPPAPVVAPPAFVHEPGAKPQTRPYHSPELRRANSRMSSTTLSQLADSGHLVGPEIATAGVASAWRENDLHRDGKFSEDHGPRGVIDDASKSGINANRSSPLEGMVLVESSNSTPDLSRSPAVPSADNQNTSYSSSPAEGSAMPVHTLLSPYDSAPRSVSPLSQSSTYSSPTTPRKAVPGPLSNFSRQFNQQPQQNITDFEKFSPESTAQPTRAPPSIPMDDPRPEPPHRSSTSLSINRKPVPGASQPRVGPDHDTSAARSSLESMRQHFIDEDALDQIVARHPTRSSTDINAHDRRASLNSSVYDNDSVVSPDYASTRRSVDTHQSAVSMEKPRAGVLRTVGTTESMSQPPMTDVPDFDFGPTRTYTPGTGTRTSASETLTQPLHEDPMSSDHLIPGPQNESPLGGGVQRNGNAYSPRNSTGPISSFDERPPSRKLTTPEFHNHPLHSGPDQDNRRSVAWQPGTTIGGGSPSGRQSITPEQFVQQRAATSRVTPIYAHGRKQSGTPPLGSRNPSAELPVQQHSRQSSFTKELPPRPQSRGASTVMNPVGDYSTLLSAREQEHVARVTGSPLINMTSNPNKQLPQGVGLVGAIEAREKERKEMKEGLSGQMVQHAIAQRHQQQNQGYQQQVQGQGQQYTQQPFPSPSPQMHVPGQYPQTPIRSQSSYGWNMAQQSYGQQAQPVQQQQQQQQQSQWVSPAAQLYWSASQNPSPYQAQPHQAQGFSQGLYQQPGPTPQAQQQYGSYFGNGQGGQ